jgi:hypothetical protein
LCRSSDSLLYLFPQYCTIYSAKDFPFEDTQSSVIVFITVQILSN